jgi:hypothetical protein
VTTSSARQLATPGGVRWGRAREVGIALGLANLLHVRHWSWFLNENNGYFRARPPHWSVGATTVVGVLTTCAIFVLAKRATDRWLPPRWARAVSHGGFLVFALLALNAVRHQVHTLTLGRLAGSAHWDVRLAAFAGAAIALVVVLVCWRARLASALAALMLWSLPFVAVTFGQGLWAVAHLQGVGPAFPDRPPAPLMSKLPGGARVVLLVFDGLDQTLAFESPNDDPQMREFELLRHEAVECTQAYPPSGLTAMSLPSLLSGRAIESADRAGPFDLRLRLQGSAGTVSWSRGENLFTRARRLGANVGAVGWYHPYCRLFGSELASCSAHQYVPEPDYSLAGDLRRHAGCLVETVPGAIRYGATARLGLMEPSAVEQRRWHSTQCQAIEAEARRAATDPALGLVFVHYPVPHVPYIYDRRSRRYDITGRSSYLDNLSLADEILGRLRSAMQGAGVWGSSTVIVTADHWNRDQDIPLAQAQFPRLGYRSHRVPLLVKTAGQPTRAASSRVIRTYAVHDLVLLVLRGDLRTSAAVLRWLETGALGTAPAGATPFEAAGEP